MLAQIGREVKRVLIVDDDPALRDGVSMLLEDEGYRVTVAANGGVAMLHLYAGQRPDLILLSVGPSVMSNWQVWRLIQDTPALADIPVVVLSTEASAASLGATAYVRKPVDCEQLLKAVQHHCKAHGQVAAA